MPATWRVLTALLQDASLGQADLRERTGLSHPVIVQQVALLRKAGLIRFGQPVSGQPGRPRIPMTFNWDFRRLLVAEVHRDGITLQHSNLRGEAAGPQTTVPLAAWTRDALRRTLIAAIGEALQTAGPAWAGISVVLPGAISPDRETILSLQDMETMDQDPLGAELTRAFDLPVLLESESAALARGLWAEGRDDAENIIAVSLRHDGRISMGMIARGKVTTGGPNSGSIGHIPIVGNDLMCACGLRGCLWTLFRAARRDPAHRQQAVAALGRVLAGLVTALNPDRLVIQGDSTWADADHEWLTAELHAHAFPGVLDSLLVESRPSRAHESLVGAINLLAGHVLDLHQGILPDWATTVPEPPTTKGKPLMAALC